jgi:aryl carrier-like protein
LVAIVSLAKHTDAGSPLTLFEGKEKQSNGADIDLLRSHISETLPIYMIPTVWIIVAAIPQLTSGKLDRKQVSQWLLDMTEDVYQRAIPATESTETMHEHATTLERTLRNIVAHVLNLPENQVPLNKPFLSLGGDSISAMQVMGQCRKQGIGLAVQEILRSKSIPQLATAVKETKTARHQYTESLETPFALTPIQSLWFALPNQGHGHFNQSFYLRLQRKVLKEDLQLAIQKLVVRHSMLRSRFTFSDESGWRQRLTDDVTGSYRFRHRAVSGKTEIDSMIEDSQKCLDHVKGPLFAADVFDIGGEQHAFLVGHHLVIDLVSWRVLLEELEEILLGNELLSPGLPFQTWAQLQQDQARTLDADKVVPPVDIPALDYTYWGIEHRDNIYGNAGHSSFTLSPELTALFVGDCHHAMKTEPVEVLLASLFHSWSRVFTDRSIPPIYNEGHGREPWDSELDISRTVGWFTTGMLNYTDPDRCDIDLQPSISCIRCG